MSRWLPTAALAAALVASSLAGCGSPASSPSGKAVPSTSGAGPASTGRPAETARDTAKTSAGHHDPG